MKERFQAHSTNSKKHFTLRVDSFERKFGRILIVFKRSRSVFVKKVIQKRSHLIIMLYIE